MTIKPLADRVLVKPAPAEEKTIGGIIIPDTAPQRRPALSDCPNRHPKPDAHRR